MAIVVNQNRKKYSFASVGQLAVDVVDNTPGVEVSPPIGIKTPIKFDTQRDDFFEMHRDLSKQISDNLKNLIQTNHGERLMLPDFGANLLPIAFELAHDSGVSQALRRIKSAVDKFMPFIELGTFESLMDEGTDANGLAKIGVRVGYSVPKANIFDQQIEVLIHVAG